MPVELRKHTGVSTWGVVERPGKTSESVDAINTPDCFGSGPEQVAYACRGLTTNLDASKEGLE